MSPSRISKYDDIEIYLHIIQIQRYRDRCDRMVMMWVRLGLDTAIWFSHTPLV